MNTVTFTLILQSNTHHVPDLIRRTITFMLFAALMRLHFPAFIIVLIGIVAILPGTMMVREFMRLAASDQHASDEAAALNVSVRGIYPGAPAIGPVTLKKLVRAGELVIDGEDGSRLHLVLSAPVQLVKMRIGYRVRATYFPGDYGLGEFDRIMRSLVHNAPVAAAASATATDEKNPDLPTISELQKPAKPDSKGLGPVSEITAVWKEISDAATSGFQGK